jgi:hypothetical protein
VLTILGRYKLGSEVNSLNTCSKNIRAMKQQQEWRRQFLPGFTAKFSLATTIFSCSLSANHNDFSKRVSPASYYDCPKCKVFCDPCHYCIKTASNPRSCSQKCINCFSCDCAPTHSALNLIYWRPVQNVSQIGHI